MKFFLISLQFTGAQEINTKKMAKLAVTSFKSSFFGFLLYMIFEISNGKIYVIGTYRFKFYLS